MFITIGIIFFLILNFVAIQKTKEQFVNGEIIAGVKYGFLTLATLIILFSLFYQVRFDFSSIAKFITITYSVTKIFNLLITYTINIYRIENKLEYFSSWWITGTVFVIVGLVNYFTNSYNLIKQNELLLIEAITYPMFGAVIAQQLESIKRKEGQ